MLYPDVVSAIEDATSVDIIAVHGLNPRGKSVSAHAWDTWRTPAGPEGRLWLRDDLPKVFPEARIFLWVYDATVAFGRDYSAFADEANCLLEDIRKKRAGEKERQLIFLGHSLGGLLVEQALLKARRSARYMSIESAITCLAFFATPLNNREMTPLSLGKMASEIARTVGFQRDDSVFETLKRGNIFEDLVQSRVLHPYDIVSFWGTLDKIVLLNNAQLSASDARNIAVIKLVGDHSGVCKFGRYENDEDNLGLVLQALGRSHLESDKRRRYDLQRVNLDMNRASEAEQSQFTSPPNAPKSWSIFTTGLKDLSLDQGSPSEYASDTESIDGGPIESPARPQDDLHITNPLQWSSKLSRLEDHVIKSARIYKSRPEFDGIMRVGQCLLMLDEALRNHEFLMRRRYCGESLNFITTSAERPGVAYLQRISREDMQEIVARLSSGNHLFCARALKGWHFDKTITALETILGYHDRLEALATIFSRLFALAVISFSGAHMERFDEAFRELEQPRITIYPTIQLRLRSLKCLDDYLGHQQVWVFEDGSDLDASADGPLYLSTTMSEFDSVWGPVWVDLEARSGRPPTEENINHCPILRYKVGTGSVIPSPWSDAHPELRKGEMLAHFTRKESDIASALPFPPGVSQLRLLIGAQPPKLKIKKRCSLEADTWLCEMRTHGLMRRPDTDRPRRELDSQAFTMQLSGLGANTSYQETWKIRKMPLKERILASWTNAPGERDPQLMSRRVAVKVSACSRNAKRVRLCRALGSSTMQRYLESIRYWTDKPTGLEAAYFMALNHRDIRTFEELWCSCNADDRTSLGTAVALSLKALSHTGTHGENLSFNAFWTTENETEPWMMTVPHMYSRWTGLLSDTSISATFAVVTNDCLVLREIEGFGCREQRHHKSQSLLETSMLINPEALKSRHANRGLKSDMIKLEKNFDLGESGRLQFSCLISQDCFLMEWKSRELVAGMRDVVHDSVMGMGPRPCHWESAYEADRDARAAESHLDINLVQVHVK